MRVTKENIETDKEIIKSLKTNTAPFAMLSKEKQKCLRAHASGVEVFSPEGKWIPWEAHYVFTENIIARISDSYMEIMGQIPAGFCLIKEEDLTMAISNMADIRKQVNDQLDELKKLKEVISKDIVVCSRCVSEINSIITGFKQFLL